MQIVQSVSHSITVIRCDRNHQLSLMINDLNLWFLFYYIDTKKKTNTNKADILHCGPNAYENQNNLLLFLDDIYFYSN